MVANTNTTVNYHIILNVEKVGLNYYSNLPKYCLVKLTPELNVIKTFCHGNVLPFHGNTIIQ
jgi:hypothetical protein